MAQYKTIAGPIGLEANKNEDYDTAVRRYAAIIDEEAVGGWELAWIQQIPVIKTKVNIGGVISVAVIGAIIGFIIFKITGASSDVDGLGLLFGAILGAGIGYAIFQNKIIEFFNMLVFVNRDSSFTSL